MGGHCSGNFHGVVGVVDPFLAVGPVVGNIVADRVQAIGAQLLQAESGVVGPDGDTRHRPGV